MITDEQVMKACDAYDEYNVDHNNTLLRGACSGHAMRNAIEAYEQSKWVKFDINDQSTYPPLETDVACDEGYAVYLLRRTEKEFAWKFSDSDDTPAVTHWQPLPTFNP